MYSQLVRGKTFPAPEALLALGDIYLEVTDEPERAEAFYRTLSRDHPNDPRVHSHCKPQQSQHFEHTKDAEEPVETWQSSQSNQWIN